MPEHRALVHLELAVRLLLSLQTWLSVLVVKLLKPLFTQRAEFPVGSLALAHTLEVLELVCGFGLEIDHPKILRLLRL